MTMETPTHWLLDFALRYSNYHETISSILCVIGIVVNCVFIAVLARRRMRPCVTNLLLLAVAANDLLVRIGMLLYFGVPFCSVLYFTRAWMSYVRIYANVTVVCHSCSLWLTVQMAALRYVVLTRNIPQNNIWNESWRHALRMVLGTFALVIVGYSLNIARHEVRSRHTDWAPLMIRQCTSDDQWAMLLNDTPPSLLGFVQQSVYNLEDRGWYIEYKLLASVNYWLQATVFKLIPCLLLAVFSGLLIRILVLTHRRHRRLLLAAVHKPSLHPSSQTYHTVMLVCIASVYLLTEAPQGIASLAIGVMRASTNERTRRAAERWYGGLGDLLDLLALLQSTFNFVLYCLMSQQFRTELCIVLRSPFTFSLRRETRSPFTCLPTSNVHRTLERPPTKNNHDRSRGDDGVLKEEEEELIV